MHSVDDPGATSAIETARRSLIAGLVFTAIVLAVLGVWFLGPVLLLVFAAVLFATFLRAIADPVHHWTGLPASVASLLVAVSLLAALVIAGVVAGPALQEQAQILSTSVPSALERVDALLSRLGLPSLMEDGAASLRDLQPLLVSRGAAAARWVAGLVGTVTGALAAGVFVFLAGIYLAVQPRTYRRGAVGLLPASDRSHAREVLDAVGTKLRGWLFGQIASMAVVGVLTAVGLSVLGVPLALLLSVLAFSLAFVPNLGPLIALAAAVLVTLGDDPGKVAWVVGLYVGVQMLESYLITPLIQRRASDIPPAVLLTAQLLFGAMWGFLGVLFAAPLTAAILVLVQRLWRADVLGDEPGKPGPAPA